jgi:hypothetical protein
MDHLEILIDKMLIIVPTDLPHLTILMRHPEGRYIVFSLVVVCGFTTAWLLFALLVKTFRRDHVNRLPSEPSVEMMSKSDASSKGNPSDQEGFSFFKKPPEVAPVENSDDSTLLAIEQEMLAVRQLYTEGHLLREVYVSETRRLFEEAKKQKA